MHRRVNSNTLLRKLLDLGRISHSITASRLQSILFSKPSATQVTSRIGSSSLGTATFVKFAVSSDVYA